ncbi:OmpA/MotB family protein [Salisaeta longa]|uniref:OmpA/MotB family protein n=1 Tax=Salisaeta longa TaxID=503170 RepID=UPI0003B4DF6F|nr:OmpA family protein [Salisaeta longa]
MELERRNAELQQQIGNLQQRINELQRKLTSNVARRGETVRILSTDVYFKSGSADLTPTGVDKLAEVAATIKQQYPQRVIRVEGFTDNKPIGDRLKSIYPSNWELSAARAAAVVRHFRWTHNIDPVRMEVVGYGQFHPVASNDTAEGRSKNRRVRVAVMPKSDVPPNM